MDFGTLRGEFDNLKTEIEELISKKSVGESSEKLKKAQNVLSKLKKAAKGEIQNKAVERRTAQLESLEAEFKKILSRRGKGKRDGNLVFKCNWNDKHYRAPCSETAYKFNIKHRRAWCSSPACECRQYTDRVTLSKPSCHESIALKEMRFGAGWNHTGRKLGPRHIEDVQEGRMAILTTVLPDTKEKDRLVIGCLYIDKVQNSPGEETIIFGDKQKSFEVDYDSEKINFWNYYETVKGRIRWGHGLFRYISDETTLNILKGIGEKYTNAGKDTGKIIDFIKYYEKTIRDKNKEKDAYGKAE